MTHPAKRFLRAMAWQRAKGELLSILETYCSSEELTIEGMQSEEEKFQNMDKAIKEFIEKVEEEELAL